MPRQWLRRSFATDTAGEVNSKGQKGRTVKLSHAIGELI